jgi:hypothetical protein
MYAFWEGLALFDMVFGVVWHGLALFIIVYRLKSFSPLTSFGIMDITHPPF